MPVPVNTLHHATRHLGHGARQTMLQAPQTLPQAQAQLAPLAGQVRTVTAAGAIPGSVSQNNKNSRALREDQRGVTLKTLDGISSASDMAFMGDGLLMAAGFVGGGAHYMAEKGRFGKKAFGTIGNTLDAVAAPRHYMENTPIEGFASQLTEKALGEPAAQNVRAGEAVIGNIADKTVTRLAKVVAPAEGLYQKLAARRARQIPKSIDGLNKQLERFETLIDQHRPALASGNGKTHLATTEKQLSKLKALYAKDPAHITLQQSQTLHGELNATLGELAKAHEHNEPAMDAMKVAEKGLERLGKPINKYHKILESQSFWKDVPAALKNMPKEIGQMSAHQFAFNAAMGTGILLQAGNTVHAIKNELHQIEQIWGQMEGKSEPVGLFHLLTHTPPKPIKDMLHQMTHKYGPEMLAEAGVGALTIMMMGRHVDMSKMIIAGAGQSALMPVAEMFKPEYNTVAIFSQIQQLKEQGEEVPHSAYAALLVGSSKQVRDANGMSNKLMHAVANDYEQMQADPLLVLQELGNGKFEERSAKHQQELEKAGSQPGETIDDKTANRMELEAKHVQETGQELAEPETLASEENASEIMGKHTAKLAKERQSVTPQTPVMPQGEQQATHSHIAPSNQIETSTVQAVPLETRYKGVH